MDLCGSVGCCWGPLWEGCGGLGLSRLEGVPKVHDKGGAPPVEPIFDEGVREIGMVE